MVETSHSAAEPPRERILRELDGIAEEFPEVPREHVERLVDDAVREFAEARLTDYVPLLVYRRVRARLAALDAASMPRSE